MVAAVAADAKHSAEVVLDSPSAEVETAPDDSVRVAEQRGGHLAADLTNANKRFLVVSEVWHPGWRAKVDGQEAPLLRTNVALMGLWAPPGKHRLVLEFRPLYWQPALILSIVSGCVIAGLGLFALYSARKRLLRQRLEAAPTV
jgi:uncharacterized membrane protein YfhO